MGVFHGFDHHMAGKFTGSFRTKPKSKTRPRSSLWNVFFSGQNEWNDNAHLQRQRVQQIASKIPTVILQE